MSFEYIKEQFWVLSDSLKRTELNSNSASAIKDSISGAVQSRSSFLMHDKKGLWTWFLLHYCKSIIYIIWCSLLFTDYTQIIAVITRVLYKKNSLVNAYFIKQCSTKYKLAMPKPTFQSLLLSYVFKNECGCQKSTKLLTVGLIFMFSTCIIVIVSGCVRQMFCVISSLCFCGCLSSWTSPEALDSS